MGGALLSRLQVGVLPEPVCVHLVVLEAPRRLATHAAASGPSTTPAAKQQARADRARLLGVLPGQKPAGQRVVRVEVDPELAEAREQLPLHLTRDRVVHSLPTRWVSPGHGGASASADRRPGIRSA